MALPFSITVSGAGTGYTVDGTFNPSGTFSGATAYTNGSAWICCPGNSFGGYEWVLGRGTTPSSAVANRDYQNAGGSTTSFPLTGWVTYINGTVPEPTFTVGSVDTTPPVIASPSVASDGVTWTIPLTETGSPPCLPASGITGFTPKIAGVAKAFTSVTCSGTTITATCSTTAAFGQTLTLDYAGGSASTNVHDSASTPNYMAASSANAVTNNRRPAVSQNGAAVAIPAPNSGTNGRSAPSSGGWAIYNSANTLVASGSSCPVTNNGFTVSGSTFTPSIAADATVTIATGYYFIWNSVTAQGYGFFDVVADTNLQVTKGGASVNIGAFSPQASTPTSGLAYPSTSGQMQIVHGNTVVAGPVAVNGSPGSTVNLGGGLTITSDVSNNPVILTYPSTATQSPQVGLTLTRYINIVGAKYDNTLFFDLVAGSVDTTAPVFASASCASDGVTWTIPLTETGSPPCLPASGITGFTPKIAGVAKAFTSVTCSGTTITATCSTAAVSGQALSLDYSGGSASTNVHDSASTPNYMAASSANAVTNLQHAQVTAGASSVAASETDQTNPPSLGFGLVGFYDAANNALGGGWQTLYTGAAQTFTFGNYTAYLPVNYLAGTGMAIRIQEAGGTPAATGNYFLAHGGTPNISRYVFDSLPGNIDTVLTDSFAATGVTRIAAIFSDKLFSDSYTPSHLTGAIRAFGDRLLADRFTPQGVNLVGVAFNDSLLSDAGGRKPITFATLLFSDSLLSDAGGRTGAASGAGGTSPPFTFSDTLFSDSGSLGILTGSVRHFSDSLLTDAFALAAIHRASVAFTDKLFADSANFGSLALPRNASVNDEDDPFVVARLFLQLLAMTKGNSMISTAKLLLILDKLAASYRTAESQAQSNILAGLELLIIGGDGTTSTIYGTGDNAFILKTVSTADAMVTNSSPDIRNGAIYTPFMSTIASYLSSVGGSNYSNLDNYATYQNGITPNSFLVHPNAAYLQFLNNNKQGIQMMQPGNVFAPLTTFGTVAVGAAGSTTFTHLADILSANAPTSKLQGYTAAPGVQAQVTTAVNGTLTITVTGTGQNAAGAAVSGRTWTGVLSSKTVGQVVTLTPTIAGDRIYSVTGVSGTGTATAGAFNLNSVLERVVS